MLLFQLFFRQICMCCIIFFKEVGYNLIESIVTFLLGQSLLSNIIGWLIQLVIHLLTQIFVVHLMVVLALHIFTQFLIQLLLHGTHRFNSLMCRFQSFNKVKLRHFIHFTFHHHDIVFGGTYHQIHIGTLHLFKCWVHHIFTVDACYTNFTDIEIERNIWTCHGCWRCQPCQSIGLIYAIGRKEHDLYIHFCVIIGGE